MPLEKTRGISGTLSNELEVAGSINTLKNVTGSLSTPTERIVPGDYDNLRNKPIINGHTVEGDKTDADYNLQHKMDNITDQMIDNVIYG